MGLLFKTKQDYLNELKDLKTKDKALNQQARERNELTTLKNKVNLKRQEQFGKTTLGSTLNYIKTEVTSPELKNKLGKAKQFIVNQNEYVNKDLYKKKSKKNEYGLNFGF